MLIYLSIYLSTYLPTYLSIYLSIYLSNYLSIYLSIYSLEQTLGIGPDQSTLVFVDFVACYLAAAVPAYSVAAGDPLYSRPQTAYVV